MDFNNLSEADQHIYDEAKNIHDERIKIENECAVPIMVEMAHAQREEQLKDQIKDQIRDQIRDQTTNPLTNQREEIKKPNVPEFDEEACRVKIQAYLRDHPDANYEYLVRGAKLACRMGTHIRRLNLPIDHGVYMGAEDNKRPAIHAEDAAPEHNIMYFGLCDGTIASSDVAETVELEMIKYDSRNNYEGIPIGSVKRGYKCKPDIIGNCWAMTHHDTRIVKNGLKAQDTNAADSVTAASCLVCRYGGLIEPLTCGQFDPE
jgi:hypothetical protein